MSYEYPGYVAFVDRAIAELALPAQAPLGRHMAALRAMDTMAVQLIAAAPADRAGVLKHIQAQRDALIVAARAADLLYLDVAKGLSLRHVPHASAAGEVVAPVLATVKKPRAK